MTTPYRWKNRIDEAIERQKERDRQGANRDWDIMDDGSSLLPFGDVYRMSDLAKLAEQERPIVKGIKGKQLAVVLGLVAILGAGVVGITSYMQMHPVRETAKPARKTADNDADWTVPAFRRAPEYPMPTDEEMNVLEAQENVRRSVHQRGAEAFFSNGR